MTRLPPIRLRVERKQILPVTLLLAAMIPAFASCADAEDSRVTPDDASVAIPETSVADGEIAEAGLDGGCDASEANCVSEAITCDEAPWCLVPTPVSTLFALTSVWGSGPNDVWAVGSGGSIVHWDGTAWKPTATNVNDTFHAVWGSGPNDVWTASTSSTILHCTGFDNNTAEWVRVRGAVDDANASAVLSLWGNDAGALRIGTRGSYILLPDERFDPINQFTLRRESDGGMVWDPMEGTWNVLGFWGSASDLWLIADNSEFNDAERGQTMHGLLDDSGALAWTRVDSQSTSRLEGIWGSSEDDIWAVGEKGTIRRKTKSAASWQIIASPTTEELHAIWGSAADDIWAVGDSGTILHFDGTAWQPSLAAFALGTKPDLHGVWGSSKNDVWIVGDNVSFHYTGPKPGAQGGGH